MNEHITSLIIDIISYDNTGWKESRIKTETHHGVVLLMHWTRYGLGTASSHVECNCSISWAVFDPGAAHISRTCKYINRLFYYLGKSLIQILKWCSLLAALAAHIKFIRSLQKFRTKNNYNKLGLYFLMRIISLIYFGRMGFINFR